MISTPFPKTQRLAIAASEPFCIAQKCWPLIKLLKFHHFASGELGILPVGMIVAFAVSIFAIRFLMQFIKQYDFKAFGWYRIVLGIIVLSFFLIGG